MDEYEYDQTIAEMNITPEQIVNNLLFIELSRHGGYIRESEKEVVRLERELANAKLAVEFQTERKRKIEQYIKTNFKGE